LITPADEAVVRATVGTRTYTRGCSYAAGGRVLACEWDGDTRVEGSVRGTASRPYQISVTLRRSVSGRILSLASTCSCPVGSHCKHAVALLLAGHVVPRAGRPVARPTGAKAPRAAARRAGAAAPRVVARPIGRPGPGGSAWERPLAALLGPGGSQDRGSASQVGLQFELVAGRGTTGRGPGSGPAVRLRPVALSPAGNWVRTGISWDRLDYFHYGRHYADRTPEVIALLQELLAMSRPVGRRAYWSSREELVSLEAVGSRRVWDLLGQLQEAGAPLLLAGRTAGAVHLRPIAEVVLDVTRRERGLVLEARYASGASDIPAGSSVLVGNPPHGIAWWDEVASGDGPALSLAPFLRPLGAERDLVESGGLAVPQRQARRFLADVCPRLLRRVALRSSDGSVDLSALPDVLLALLVRHGPGHRVELAWGTALPGGWRGGLWDGADGALDPVVAEAIETATGVVGKLPSLVEPGPWGQRIVGNAVLEDMDAVVFLTDLLPRLQEIEGLEVEQEGVPIDYRAAADAPLVTLGGSESAGGDWFDLSVEVSVGGEAVVFGELFSALAQGQSHLILPSGTYFSLDGPELADLGRLITEARAMHDAEPGVVRISRFQASLWEDFRRLGCLTAQAEAWEASVQALITASDVGKRTVPASLEVTLRPYQVAGFRWLAFLYQHKLGGILADDMGLGKTLEALALVCHAREEGLTAAPFLVVAPTSVVGNWASECRRFAPGLSVVALAETTARRGTALAEAAAGADLLITSYALFRLDYEEYEQIEWAGLLLDEAQFAKNSASHAYRRAKTLPAPFKLAMTGTPLENNLMELWSLLSISAPGLFPRAEHFREHYRVPIERESDPERLEQLRRRVRPLMLRRTKDQVEADLPDKQEQVLELDLEARHRRVYQTYLQRERQKVLGLLGDFDRNRFMILRSLTLLRQASLDVSLVDPKHARVPSTKLDALLPMLEEAMADGHRVLVFSQFTRFLTMARRRVQAAGIEHCYLDGRTRRRADVISDFRQGRAHVFLISLKAGGVGLNLTEADYCILLDPWWNPATEAQAVDRVHRIGQTRKVMVYRMVARETIEEKVMALKAKKAALFANVLDGGGFESAALSAEDIRQLLD